MSSSELWPLESLLRSRDLPPIELGPICLDLSEAEAAAEAAVPLLHALPLPAEARKCGWKRLDVAAVDVWG